MEILDFAEQQGQRAAAFSLATLDANRQRSHSLLVLLLGGAGAMGGLALGMAPGNALLTLAAFSVAVSVLAYPSSSQRRAMLACFFVSILSLARRVSSTVSIVKIWPPIGEK